LKRLHDQSTGLPDELAEPYEPTAGRSITRVAQAERDAGRQWTSVRIESAVTALARGDGGKLSGGCDAGVLVSTANVLVTFWTRVHGVFGD